MERAEAAQLETLAAVSEPTYIDGTEVHAGDRVSHFGAPATVVLVASRGEALAGYSLAEWSEFGNVLIRQDDGDLYMHEHLSNEEDVIRLVSERHGG